MTGRRPCGPHEFEGRSLPGSISRERPLGRFLANRMVGRNRYNGGFLTIRYSSAVFVPTLPDRLVLRARTWRCLAPDITAVEIGLPVDYLPNPLLAISRPWVEVSLSDADPEYFLFWHTDKARQQLLQLQRRGMLDSS